MQGRAEPHLAAKNGNQLVDDDLRNQDLVFLGVVDHRQAARLLRRAGLAARSRWPAVTAAARVASVGEYVGVLTAATSHAPCTVNS